MNNSIFHFFFNLSQIPFIAKLAIFLSYPFTYGVLFVLIIWVLFFSKNKISNASFIFLPTFFSWITAVALKSVLKINRPFTDFNIIPLYNETGFSLPSEHMAVFTAVAVSMFFINKKLSLVFFIIAILVGLSRIVIGVHSPVDIIGGFLVGLIISIIFRAIFKKI